MYAYGDPGPGAPRPRSRLHTVATVPNLGHQRPHLAAVAPSLCALLHGSAAPPAAARARLAPAGARAPAPLGQAGAEPAALPA